MDADCANKMNNEYVKFLHLLIYILFYLYNKYKI